MITNFHSQQVQPGPAFAKPRVNWRYKQPGWTNNRKTRAASSTPSGPTACAFCLWGTLLTLTFKGRPRKTHHVGSPPVNLTKTRVSLSDRPKSNKNPSKDPRPSAKARPPGGRAVGCPSGGRNSSAAPGPAGCGPPRRPAGPRCQSRCPNWRWENAGSSPGISFTRTAERKRGGVSSLTTSLRQKGALDEEWSLSFL